MILFRYYQLSTYDCGNLGTVRRFLEKNIDAFQVVVFVVEPIDEVSD